MILEVRLCDESVNFRKPAIFSHTQNPIIKIYLGTFQPKDFPNLPVCFIVTCKFNMMNFLLSEKSLAAKINIQLSNVKLSLVLFVLS